MMEQIQGPHQRVLGDDPSPQQRLLAFLFDSLWERYREEVPPVQQYEQVIAQADATFVNDHLAFRTLGSAFPSMGVASLAPLFQSLGYVAEGCYLFPDKCLSALHLRHPLADFPKLFISELQLWRLPPAAQQAASASLASYQQPLDNELLHLLSTDTQSILDAAVLERLVAVFRRPWDPPAWSDVQSMNEHSQYGAWTMLHGYRVNHFTSLVNSHGVPSLRDLERTVAALRAAGVPMKAEIEGEPGSQLRQTATAAASIPVSVWQDGAIAEEQWSYAYFELAERGEVVDPETGKRHRFEGFLGPQATQLFEMTKQ